MSLLFFDGFDYVAGGGQGGAAWDLPGGGDRTYTTPFGFGCSYYLGGGAYMQKTISGSLTRIIVGFCWYPYPEDQSILQFFDASAAQLGYIRWHNSTGVLAYHNGTSEVALCNTAVEYYNWHYIEVDVTFDDTAGAVAFQVNGQAAGSTSNIDTVSGALGGRVLRYVKFFQLNIFDDVYMCDTTGPAPWNTFLGWVRVKTFLPTSDASVAFSRSSGATNASNLDDSEVDWDSTYVQSHTNGTRDNYGTGANVAGTVYGVKAFAYGKKTDTSNVSLKVHLRSGSTDASTAAIPLDLAYKHYSVTSATDPATSAQWTAAGANAAQPCIEAVV